MNTLISPVQSKELKLDESWAELLTKQPSQQILWDIVRLVPYLRDRAWAEFTKSNPSKEELSNLILYGDTETRMLPARRILANFFDQKTLRELIKKIPELCDEVAVLTLAKAERESLVLLLEKTKTAAIAEEAAQALLKLAPTSHEMKTILLSQVITATSESKRQVARIIIADEKPDQNDLLLKVLWRVPEFTTEIWQKYKSSLDDHILATLLQKEPNLPFRIEVGRIILERNTEFSPLFHVFRYVPELRTEAWEKLMNIELSWAWLEALEREAPEFTGKIIPLRVALKEREGRTSEIIYNEILGIK